MEAEEASPKSLSDFPKVNKLWLATSHAEILPAGHHEFKARTTGEIQFLKKEGEAVKAGEVWAVEMPQRLAFEKKSILLEERILGEKLKGLKMDYEEKLEVLREARDNLVDQQTQLDEVLLRKELLEDELLMERTKMAYKRLKSKIARAEKRLKAAEEGTLNEAEQEKLILDLRRRKEEFKNLQRGSELRSPIEGVIEFEPSLWPEGESTELVPAPPLQWVENGNRLAKVMNESGYEVILLTGINDLESVSREKLSLILNANTKDKRVDAVFLRSENLGGRDQSERLVFQVKKEHFERARAMSGVRGTALVYVNFEQARHLVPKSWLLGQFGSRGRLMTWSGMIAKLSPKARIVAEGHDGVVVDVGAPESMQVKEKGTLEK